MVKIMDVHNSKERDRFWEAYRVWGQVLKYHFSLTLTVAFPITLLTVV